MLVRSNPKPNPIFEDMEGPITVVLDFSDERMLFDFAMASQKIREVVKNYLTTQAPSISDKRAINMREGNDKFISADEKKRYENEDNKLTEIVNSRKHRLITTIGGLAGAERVEVVIEREQDSKQTPLLQAYRT